MSNTLAERAKTFLETPKNDWDATAIGQLLDECSIDGKPPLAAWGALLSAWLSLDIEHVGNAGRLGSYLQAIDREPIESIMADGGEDDVFYRDPRGQTRVSKPVYAALDKVARALLGDGCVVESNPLLRSLVDSGAWNPHALLDKLHGVILDQYDYMELYYGDTVHFMTTAEGAWLDLAGPLLMDTDWTPPASDVYNELWKIRMVPSLDSEPEQQARYQQYAKSILTKIPGQAIGGLESIAWFMHCTRPWSQDTWEAFFPLPIESTPTKPLLEAVIKLVHAAKTHGVTKADDMMRMHHPELLALVEVHLGMFGGSDFTDAINVDHLVDTFEAQKSGTAAENAVTFPLEDWNDEGPVLK